MTTYYNFEIWETGEMESNDRRLYEDFDELCDVADEILSKRIDDFVKPDRRVIKEKLNARPNYAVWYTHKENEKIYDTRIYINQMKVVPKKPDTVDCDAQDKHLETHFDEIFKRSREVTYLNGHPVRNTWYDPTTRWVYQAYFSEGEKPQTFYDIESRNIKTIDFVKPKKYVYQYFVENDYKGITSLSLKASQKYASFDEACDAMDKELSELYEVDGKEPLQRNRLVIKTLLETSSRITYASYNDGGSTTDKYVLCRQEV